MVLDEEEIRLLLDLLQLQEVYHDGDFVVCKRVRGYRGEVGTIQAKLSVMLGMLAAKK